MAETMVDDVQQRRGTWVWSVCVLLLLASTINYMDRLTLSSVAPRIKSDFQLDRDERGNQRYGTVETAFGLAFAVGALFWGNIADRVNIRWLYPLVLLAWSTMGFFTGVVETYTGLLLCRFFLGFFEAGHWPCALKTTQRLLPPHRRGLGNSVLQSGTAIGAILTPQIIKWMVTPESGSWRPAFQAIGLIGAGWVVMWLCTVRGRELAPKVAISLREMNADGETPSDEEALLSRSEGATESFWSVIFHRRFVTLFCVVILINTAYHFYRVWLTLFLMKGREYSEPVALDVLSWFYIVNDVGCITAGFATTWLHRRGLSVHASRLWVFGACSLLTASSLSLPFLPTGSQLIAALMVLSLGSLGLFPCYYSFSQDLTTAHQGKVTGLLGFFAWAVTSPLHPMFGRFIDQTGRHDWGLALAGLLPLVALCVLIVGWGRDSHPRPACA